MDVHEIYLFVVAVLAGAIRAGTPILFAALGETVYQRSGVLNLGLEGMMLLGALTGVVVQVTTGNFFLACCCAAGAAGFAGILHAVLSVYCRANQIVTGLAFVFLLQGLTALWGRNYVGRRVVAEPANLPAFFQDIPFLGPVVFGQNVLFFVGLLLMALIFFFLFKTRRGVMLRAAGENASFAALSGVPVNAIRIAAGGFCGACCGIGGACLALTYASQWQENMVSGRGWIALVLVIFGRWHPVYVFLGALLFGGLTSLQLNLQAHGIALSSHLLGALPFVVTIIALVWSTITLNKKGVGMPADLGRTYDRER